MPPHTTLLSDVYRRPRSIRTTLILAALVLAGLTLGHVVSATPSSASISWRGDYETGDFSQWTYGVQQKTPSRATVVQSVEGGSPRQGRYAARFEVDSGDSNVGGSGSGERDEALIPTALTGAGEGVEQWWAWSTYFPSDFTTGDGMWNFFTQFHHTGESGQSNIEFTVKDNSSLVMISNSGNASQPSERDFTLGPLVKGHWADFVFHVRWSSDSSVGFVQVFLNGAQVVSQTSIGTLYSGQGVYLKQGFYRAACSCTTVVYQDGMRRGSSYGDVVADFPAGTWPASPGGSVSPPPSPPPTTTTAPPPPATTTTAPPPSTTTTTTGTTTTQQSTTQQTATQQSTTTQSSGGSPNGNGNANGNGAGKGAKSKRPGSVEWNGRLYTSAPTLRRELASQGNLSWEAFLELHPAAAKQFQLIGVTYGGVFYTKQALSRWLSAHGANYAAWAHKHPAAASRLASQPANTRTSDALSLVAKHTHSNPRVLHVVAHAFPGAKATIVVKAGGVRVGTVTATVDYTGRIDSLVKLHNWSGQKHLSITLTAVYPEGPRTKTAPVRVVQSLKRAH
jgi:hypothetical protein